MATNKITGTNTTEAYRASTVLLEKMPPTMAAPRVPAMAMARGRAIGRVRMSMSMWRRSTADPNRPSPARTKKTMVSTHPSLEKPPVKVVSVVTMAPKLEGVAHGVPVCRDWNTKVGSQGRNVRQPAAAARSAALAPGRHAGRPRHACHASHNMTVPTRYSDQ